MLRSLDLFAGAGGFAVGLHGVARPAGYCDIDPGAQAVLERRMAQGHLPRAPIFPDVRALEAAHLPRVDLVTAGFPCQDLSTIGRPDRAGLRGHRSGLVGEVLRLVHGLRPRYCVFENVPPIVNDPHLVGVIEQLAREGYDAAYAILDAASLGAVHRRRRWFLVARRRGPVQPDEPKLVRRSQRTAARLAALLALRAPATCDRATCERRPAEHRLWGNAVVPAAVAAAFALLLARLLSVARGEAPEGAAECGGRGLPPPSSGYLRFAGGALAFPGDGRALQDPGCSAAGRTFTVDPSRLLRDGGRAPGAMAQQLPDAAGGARTCLPTPRAGMSSQGTPRAGFSERTQRDLPPVVFASRELVPDKVLRSARHAEHRINPEFLANLMGFPPGWSA
jgi:hypothetical protein